MRATSLLPRSGAVNSSNWSTADFGLPRAHILSSSSTVSWIRGITTPTCFSWQVYFIWFVFLVGGGSPLVGHLTRQIKDRENDLPSCFGLCHCNQLLFLFVSVSLGWWMFGLSVRKTALTSGGAGLPSIGSKHGSVMDSRRLYKEDSPSSRAWTQGQELKVNIWGIVHLTRGQREIEVNIMTRTYMCGSDSHIDQRWQNVDPLTRMPYSSSFSSVRVRLLLHAGGSYLPRSG